jgi:hypothetical protein
MGFKFAGWCLPIPGLSVMKLLSTENNDGDQIPKGKECGYKETEVD